MSAKLSSKTSAGGGGGGVKLHLFQLFEQSPYPVYLTQWVKIRFCLPKEVKVNLRKLV